MNSTSNQRRLNTASNASNATITSNATHASEALNASSPSTLCSLENATSILDKLCQKEIQLIEEAEQLFKRQVDYMRHVDSLQTYVPNVGQVDVDVKRTAALVDSSSDLVEEVCSKVRHIDSTKALLGDSLTKLTDILDLKSCRDGVIKSMQDHNFEEAAMHIKRYLAIDQEQLQASINIISKYYQKPCTNRLRPALEPPNIDDLTFDPHSMDVASDEIEEARLNLLKLCVDNFEKAISNDQVDNIDRSFKIFPMLNEHHEGLKRYAEYIKCKIVDPLVTVNKDSSSKKIDQANKLASLYENVAKLIDAHQPIVETYYGPGYLIDIIRVIQRQCDRYSRKILEEFRNETKLQYITKIVRNSSLQQSTGPNSLANPSSNSVVNLTPSRLDPREVDNILNEICIIISRSEVYLNFIIQRVKEDINSKTDNEASRQSSMLEFYNLVCMECELNHLIQEVGGIYVMLEQFYLNESAKKAIAMDQIDVESSSCFVSSMLDDIFFIIKKCTKRAVSTKSNEVFCAIINHCATLLESTFCCALEERLRNQQYFSSSFSTKNLDLSQAIQSTGRYLQSASELEIAKAQFFSALNNMDKACDYIKTLRSILDVDLKKLKPSILIIEHKQGLHYEKSVTCLNELSQFVSRFASIVQSYLYQMFNASLRRRVRSQLKQILIEDPELSNIGQQQNSDDAIRLAKDLLTTIDRSLVHNLTGENYARLAVICRDFVVSNLKADAAATTTANAATNSFI